MTDEHRVAQPGEHNAAHSDRVAAVLEHMALDEADLLNYATELRMDRDTYREMAVALMGKLHETGRTVQRQRETISRLNKLVRDYVGVGAEGRRAA